MSNSIFSPYSAYPPYSNIPDVYPFSQGMPMLPLYGFDAINDSNKDDAYIKSMYSTLTNEIQKEVEEECDKLEYTGSCMYHEYPDKCSFLMIAARIYEKVAPLTEKGKLESVELSATQYNQNRPPRNPPCPYGRDCPPKPPCRGPYCPPHRPDYRQDGSPDFLKHLIDVLLGQEMNRRRRRYRSRQPWR